MATLTANLAGKARRATFKGREYLVAPLTMIVPGVLNGSGGRGLYPADEVGKYAERWNAMPLTAGHPKRGGKPVSARVPAVAELWEIGRVFNARFKDGKLVAEGWFDVLETGRIAPRILNALEQGQPIELSTGLGLDPVEADAPDHDWVATNFRPDHLAILIDAVGACSRRDGCGVFNELEPVLNERQLTDNPPAAIKHSFLRWLGSTLGLTANQVFDDLQAVKQTVKESPPPIITEEPPITEEEESTMTVKLTPEQRKAFVGELVANCACDPADAPWRGKDEAALNAMTDNELYTMAQCKKLMAGKAMNQTPAPVANADWTGPDGNLNHWDGQRWVTFYPARPAQQQQQQPPAGQPAVPVAQPVANAVPRPATLQEWLSLAPPEAEAEAQEIKDLGEDQRAEHVGRLIENLTGEAREAAKLVYSGLGRKDLKRLVDALPPKDEQHQNNQNRRPSFFGGQGAPAPVNVGPEQTLDVPDFSDSFKGRFAAKAN